MSDAWLDDAARLGRRAIDAAETRIRASEGRWDTRTAKGEHDFATDLDLAVEHAMRAVLAEGDPPAAVLGEELGGATDLRAGVAWVIDPIDGTTNLIRGIPTYTVTLALMVDGVATLAFVSAPLLGERYLAARGQGGVLESADRREPLRVSVAPALRGALVGVNDIAGLGDEPSRAHAGRQTGALAGEVLQVRCHGSIALDLAWVAAGRLDACVAFSNRPWDVQAGALLVREAGGAVYDRDGTDHGLASHMTIASNANLKGALLERLGQPRHY